MTARREHKQREAQSRAQALMQQVRSEALQGFTHLVQARKDYAQNPVHGQVGKNPPHSHQGTCSQMTNN